MQNEIAERNKALTTKVILVALLLFHLVNNYIWLSMDKSYLFHDAYSHHLYSLKVYSILSGSAPFDFNSLLNMDARYGILVGLISAPFYFIFGKSQDAGVMVVSSIFLTILIFSIYGIGKRLFNRATGLLAAFMVTMYPLIFCYLRKYMLDLPLTSMETLSIYMLLLTDNFKNRKYSLAFALIAASGMLIKINFAGYIIGPLIAVLYDAFRNSKEPKNKVQRLVMKRNVLIVLAIIAVSSLFYVLKFKSVYEHFAYLNRAHYFLFRCAQDLINTSMSFLFFSVFLIGLYFFHSIKLKEKKILFLWISLPLICLYLLFFAKDHTYRYAMPVLPALAIISAGGIAAIKYSKLRKIFIFLIVVLGTIQFFAVSYGTRLLPEKIEIPFLGHIFGKHNSIVLFNQKIKNIGFGYKGEDTSQPSAVDWNIEEIFSTIMSPNDFKGGISVCFIDDIREVFEPISYRAFIERGPIDKWYVFPGPPKYTEPVEQIVLSADYIIKGSGDLGGYFNKYDFDKARGIFSKNIEKFSLVKVVSLYDGSKLTIYKNRLNSQNIKQGHLELYFRNGMCKLYNRNTEITKQWGLNTYFKSQGNHCSSFDAIWQIDKLTPSKLIARGLWPDLGFIQIWQLELSENNIVDWRIEIDTKKRISIEEGPYVNLILSDNYSKWVTLDNQGMFPPIPPWQKRWSWLAQPSPSICIGVRGNRKGRDVLPGVLLRIEEGLILNRTVPQNTYYAIKARALDVQRQKDMKEPLELDVGRHKIFSGKIFIFEQDKDLDLALDQIKEGFL